MKILILFFLLIGGILNSITASAKIRRVNSNTNIPAEFRTLADAHNGADPGDTLHLESSAVSYGRLTCTKKLVIIGPGFFLGENPDMQALKQTARVDDITFNVGSAGSVVMGLDFNGNNIWVYSHDIVIRRNKFSSASGNNLEYSIGSIYVQGLSNNLSVPASNIVISQNYSLRIDISRASNNILITNNYISYSSGSGDATNNPSLDFHPDATGRVQNNIFRRGKVTVYNSNFTNNIMVAGSFNGTGNVVVHNIGNATQFGNTNSNQQNVSMANVFVGAGEGVSPDGQWKLKVGSPAIAAGYGSTTEKPIDIGLFGNYTPYVLSGLPPIPAIYFIENEPIGSDTDPVSVTIKVKSVGN